MKGFLAAADSGEPARMNDLSIKWTLMLFGAGGLIADG